VATEAKKVFFVVGERQVDYRQQWTKYFQVQSVYPVTNIGSTISLKLFI
jgi:hypothetical protein